MVNPTGKKLEKLLFGIFDEAILSVDTYKHNGSIWLIFTDDKKWVVEYTKEQTLWYNYYFFKQEMDMVGLDCVENKDLIQKWFESKFLNKNEVEDTIQNGVKNTYINQRLHGSWVEDTIQNGVKNTKEIVKVHPKMIQDTIQNGVKKTFVDPLHDRTGVEDTIQNGVKKIRWNGELGTHLCEDVIENGVKHTENLPENNPARIEDAIQNGIKDMKESHFYRKSRITYVTQNCVKETNWKRVDNFSDYVIRVIENGVKYC